MVDREEVKSKLERINAKIESFHSDLPPLNTLRGEQLDLVKKVAQYLSSIKKTIDQEPEALSRIELDNIDHILLSGSMLDSWQRFTQERDYNALREIEVQISAIVSSNSKIKRRMSPAGRKASKKGASDIDTDVARDYLLEMERVRLDILEKYNEYQTSFASFRSNIEHLKEDEARAKKLMEERTKEINLSLLQWQKQFAEAQDRRASEYNDWRQSSMDRLQLTIDTITTERKNALAKSVLDLNEYLANTTSDIRDKHSQIQSLYSLVASDSVSGSYVETAKVEMRQTRFWRWISLAFLSGAIAWLLFSYNFGHAFGSAEEVTWRDILITFSLTAVLLWGAAYTAQLSTRYFNNSKQARWFALETKAFDPFVSDLPTDIRAELKKELSRKIFGREGQTAQPDTIMNEHASMVIVEVINKIASLLRK